MTHNERWLAKYNEVKSFFDKNRRYPGKHYPEEN